MKMKRFISFVLTLVLLFGMFPLNETIASDFVGAFSIMASALENENKTSTNYRYDDLFNEKTLPTYMDFASYYASSYSSAIPGLENTNILGNECDTMVPQAVCIAEDYMLITAYDGKEKYEEDSNLCIERDKYNSVIYVLSNLEHQSRSYLTTLVLPCKEHVGGIAFDGTNVWISNGNDKISSISYSAVQNAVTQNEDSIAIEFDKTINIDIKPSFMTYYNGNLWVGTHEEKEKGVFNAYDINMLNESDTAVPHFYSHVPSKAQGALFVEIENKPYLLLTRSLGRNTDKDGYISQMEFYAPDLSSSYVNINKSQKTLLAPPMIEGITIDGDYIYCCFESASTVYSTIEGNLCDVPVDRICALDTSMLFSYLEDYETNFDVKYTDLFYGYPYYLSNDIEDTYSDMIIEQYSSVLNSYSGFDNLFAALQTQNSEGLSIYIKEMGSLLGLTDTYYEECIDKATIELMKMVYSDETYAMDMAGSNSKGLKHLKTFVGVVEITDQLIIDNMTTLDEDEVKEISKTLKDKVDKTLSFASDAIELTKVITTACFIEDIKMSIIDSLINSLDDNAILKQGLKRLRNDISMDIEDYITETYITNKAIEDLYSWLGKNMVWENLKDGIISEHSVAKALVKLVVKGAYWFFFDIVYPIGSGEDVIVDTILSTYVTELYTAILDKKLTFHKAAYSWDIADYQTLYNTYIAAIKVTLDYSQKLAKNDIQSTNLTNAYNSVCENYTYDAYIRLCRNSVISTPYEERIIKSANMEHVYYVNSEEFSVGYPSDEIDLEHSIYLFNDELFHGLYIGDVGFTFDKSFKLPQIIGAPTGWYANSIIDVLPNVTINTDKFLNMHDNEISQKLTVIINGNLIINGDFSIKGNGLVNSHQMIVDIYGSLIVKGNLELIDYANLSIYNANLFVSGNFTTDRGGKYDPKLKMFGECSTILCEGDFAPYGALYDIDEGLTEGKIYLKGNLVSELRASGTNTLILCGEETQSICGSSYWPIQNLTDINNSNDGVTLSSDIKINGEYRSPKKKINCGEYYVRLGSNAKLYSGNYYGTIYLDNDYTFKNDVCIDGNLYIYGNKRKVTVSEDVVVKINGDVSSPSGTKNSYFINDGKVFVSGDFRVNALSMTLSNSALTIYGDADFGYNQYYLILGGIIYVYGNIIDITAGGSNTVVLCGTSPQTLSSYPIFANLVVQNTSEDGVCCLDSWIEVTGEYHSPIKKIECGEYYVKLGSNATLYPDNYYGTIRIENDYTFKNDVCIDGNLYIYGNYKITIPEGKTITINKNLSSAPGSAYVFYLINNGTLIVKGNYAISGGSAYTKMSLKDSQLTILGDANISCKTDYQLTNGTIFAYGDIQCLKASSSNTVVLCGTEKQTLSSSLTFANLIHENTSKEGIVFTNTVKVNTLFNHNGKPFTLYNNGSGSTFVDYDGDGMKDNVDPEPTVGNPCTITVTTENSEKGTVSETIDTVGGTTVTVSAEPTFKYNFNCWKDANGNVVSYDANYSFVAKSDTTLTAYFTKRQRNITTNAANGTLTVAAKAEIESNVTVTPVENEGYIYTENSITVNGVAIEGNTFTMPDEDVVLSAEFVRNDYYFALKDALTTATAIDQTMYSAETTNALKIAITNAQNSLVNNITQEESDVRIAELQSAINQLSPRYIVSISTDLTDVLVVMQNAETPLSTVGVSANYDNGTSVVIANYKVTGLDVSTLGVQAVTLSYQGFTTGISVRVTTQAILDVEAQIAELPETITLEQEEQVNTVKTVFDALSDDEKENIQNADVLFEAIETIETIYEDIDAAAIFDENVLAIAEMDGDVSNLVVAAMEEYASFTEQRKSYVTQYELLQKLNSAIPATQYFDFGLGVEQNPFVITTAIQLDMVREYPSLCYVLGNNIDLSDFVDWTPIDSFSGTLDGNGYSIENLTSTQGGLIKSLSGVLKGIELKSVRINAVHVANDNAFSVLPQPVGSLVNSMASTARVLYCSAEGDLKSTSFAYVGGLVGESLRGEIRNSYAKVNITLVFVEDSDSQYVGGLLGYTELSLFGSGKIYDCYSKGMIATDSNLDYCGGLIGYVKTGFLSSTVTQNCFAHMSFEGNGINGGFVGYLSTNRWTYSNCYYVPNDKVTASCGNYDTVTATACFTEQLASGEIAYALQNSREETIWGQDTALLQPLLTSDSAYRVYKVTFKNDSLVISEQYFFNGKELYVPDVTLQRIKNSETNPIEYYDETDYKFFGWFDENGVEFDVNCRPTSDMFFGATFEALKVIPNDTSALVIDNENGIISGITVIDNCVNMLEENFNEDVYFKVFHNDVMLNDDSMIATGDILKVVSADGNETYKEYRLAVTGDVDGNGLANHSDYEIIVAVSTCMQLLEIPYNIAADMNFDGSVDGFDAIELDLFINNMESSITINNVSNNQANYIVNNTALQFYDPKRFVHVNKI